MVDYLEAHPWSGMIKGNTRRQALGALAALDGSLGDGEARYREALGEWRRLALRPHIAITLMEMLQLFGDHLPDRESIAAEARATMQELGAASLLHRLDQVASPRGAKIAS
jgi:hypothetical protein